VTPSSHCDRTGIAVTEVPATAWPGSRRKDRPGRRVGGWGWVLGLTEPVGRRRGGMRWGFGASIPEITPPIPPGVTTFRSFVQLYKGTGVRSPLTLLLISSKVSFGPVTSSGFTATNRLTLPRFESINQTTM
jgi:hypothetical protein